MATTKIGLKELLAGEGCEEAVSKCSFENGLQLLEELVEKVESGALPLEQALLSYERGVGLIEHLRTQLTGAEQKLKLLQRGGSRRGELSEGDE